MNNILITFLLDLIKMGWFFWKMNKSLRKIFY